MKLTSKKSEAIPVTGRQGCEMLRIQHCLYNRLTDGGNISLAHLPLSTPQKHFFLFLVLIYVRGRVNPRALCLWKDEVN
jgi:hypothetical protein